MKYWSYLGIFSSIVMIMLWLVLNFFNPYNSDLASSHVLVITGLFLLAPAFIALIGSIKKQRSLMVIAGLWSLPLSLYLAMTTSIFKLFILISFCYLLSGIRMRK